jgi:dihydrofolate reductase
VLTDVKGKIFEGAEVAYSIDELLQLVKGEEEAFVIGGGMVYRQMMPLADKLYITHIHHSWDDDDTFFPEIDTNIWKKISSEEHQQDENNPYNYTFVEYIRR